mgnify:CR=1 FL=1
MNYTELLGGYISLPIKLNESRFLLKENTDLSTLNPYLFSLLAAYKVFDSNELLSEMNLTPYGIKFNLDKVKKALFEYYGITDFENPIARLKELETAIKNREIIIPNLSSLMLADFQKYEPPEYHNGLRKPKNKGKTRKFMNQIRKNIREFIKLLTNEEQCATVRDIFNERKLKLYFAYKLMLYAKYCEKNGDTTKALYAQDYIKRFLEKNPTLIASNLTIRFTKKSGQKKFWKEYQIQELVRFANIKLPKAVKKEDKIDTYSYSFFECSEEKTREIFANFTRGLSIADNSEELKALLSRKLALYKSLNITKVKIGVDSFDGYVGLVLDNGKVILDKFFEDRKVGKIATDNAIYIIREEDFEKVTRMSKTTALEAINSGLIDAVRFFHSGDYENRVKSYLTRKKPSQQ